MKTTLGILAASAALLLASSAWAQSYTTTSVGCVPPEIAAIISGDFFFYTGFNHRGRCRRACTESYALCRDLTGVNKRCLRKLNKGWKNVDDTDCKDLTDSTDRSNCLAENHSFSQDFINLIEESTEFGYEDCRSYLDSCLVNCDFD